MISIIICTAHPGKISDIDRNISDTIGVPYELIVIDNSRSQYSIFQAYNIGIKRSQYTIVCFMHDDIVYHSPEWGHEVIKYFNTPETGMLGIGGTRFLGSTPTVWWAGGHTILNSRAGIICQNCINTNRNNTIESSQTLINPEKTDFSKVVILDGLWFCIRKKLFEEIEFDESNYKGFHFYDLDISMQINRLKFDIICIFSILIEHISANSHDKEWIESCNIFYDKWKSFLPLSTVKLSFKQLLSIEYWAVKVYRDIHKMNKTRFLLSGLYRNISMSNFISFHLKTLIK